MRPQERIAAIKMYNREKENPVFVREIGVTTAMIVTEAAVCGIVPGALPIITGAAAAVSTGKALQGASKKRKKEVRHESLCDDRS